MIEIDIHPVVYLVEPGGGGVDQGTTHQVINYACEEPDLSSYTYTAHHPPVVYVSKPII